MILPLTALLAGTSPAWADEVRFGRDVLPILSDNCFHCHGPDAKGRKGKLRLDTPDGAGRVIIPGQGEASELIRRLVGTDDAPLMPPPKSNKKLSAHQIDVLKRWIDTGAKWGNHWAFEKLDRPAVPRPPATVAEVRNPIDAFIADRLQREKLQASPPADRSTLIRRLSLDLIGLPPTPQEVDAFQADGRPDAYERVVDRLLASPHLGERMVWEWLDAARYADSNGYQGDAERTMWPWRDWAVQAINRNLPFDQFTLWQLAGDLLPSPTLEQKLATGFNRNHMINGEGGRIAEENRIDYVMDMAETTGTVWLGLTFNCCRCHDHKYDPLTMRDYYGLFAFFNQTPINGGGGSPQTPPLVEFLSPEQKKKLEELAHNIPLAARIVAEQEKGLFPRPEDRLIDRLLAGLKPEALAALKVPADKRNRGQIELLEKEWVKSEPEYAGLLRKHREAIDTRDAANRAIVRVMVMEDMPKPRDTFVLERGSYEKPGEKVPPTVPGGIASVMQSRGPLKNRLDLARWLIAPDNPLTARVTVNRIWQQFFGAGLVKTAEDFGVQGEPPSHPELLDWLASEFIASGWDVKHLYRLIVTSATYRQSSKVTPMLLERDPQNRLLARGPRYRLASWMIRDQALAASGLLVRKLGGPPVKPYQPAGVWEEATFGTKRYQQDKGEALYRRSVYTFWRRIVGPTPLFDTAARQGCVVKPTRTNSPLHALTTLNDITYIEAARALAERVLTSAGPSTEARLELAFRLVLCRKPSPAEVEVLSASLARLKREFRADPQAAKKLLAVGESKRNEALDPVEHAAHAAVCTLLLNLDETLTRE